jgi:putative CocE/NonD family hydrolase
MLFVYRWMLKRLGVVATHSVSIRRDIKVRMTDGAELLTDVYLGREGGPAPAIMIRSPYGKGLFIAASTAYPLASQGFNVLLQCCRGTHGSSGHFDPHHDEQRDGLATIEWAKQQPWCNGSIATYGGSYLGYTQWAVAAEAGPEVKAMAMQITASDFSLMTYAGGSFSLRNALSWTYMVTMAKRPFATLRIVVSRLRGAPPIRAEDWAHLPLGAIEERAVGEAVPFWKDWTQHSCSDDPWWASMGYRKTIPQIQRPITLVAGWFDLFVPWQMQDFMALRQAGCESRITVGPWQHTDMELSRTGLPDAIEWFNRHLLGKNDEMNRKPVKLYVMGADEWRYFDEWPPRASITERWYLHPLQRLIDHAPPESPVDRYVYDPTDPTPSVGGPALESTPFSVDNAALESRTDVLIYTSDPLPGPREIIGPIGADLFVSSSAPSADFFVRLCDVDTTGISKNICDGLQRVTFDGNMPQRIRVELWPTAYRVAQGHCIRVQISSGAFPRWARNLGTLEPLALATELRSATQSVHHSPACPSAVILPFYRQ